MFAISEKASIFALAIEKQHKRYVMNQFNRIFGV
jgi:succinylglutamate desuccinylase